MNPPKQSYPGPWRYPIPLHPAFVLPLPYEPMEPTGRGGRARVAMVYTAREQQWWVASDRRWASAQFALGGMLKDDSVEPDAERCELYEAEDVDAAQKLLAKEYRLPANWPGHAHNNEVRLLAAQAWLDWQWVRENHAQGEHLPPRGVEWWSAMYKTGASLRTIERAKVLLRGCSRELINVLWEGVMGFAPALHFAELCPDRRTQRDLIRGFEDNETFAQHYNEGRLPLEGMLPIRIDHAVKQVLSQERFTDLEIAHSVQLALDGGRCGSMDPVEIPTPKKKKRRGRRPSKRVDKDA